MYHPDTLMTYRGTDLLTLLIYYLLGKMNFTANMLIFSNVVDMSVLSTILFIQALKMADLN